MHFQKRFLLPILMIFAAFLLSACQNAAAPAVPKAQSLDASAPTAAAQAPAPTQSSADANAQKSNTPQPFQEVNDPSLGKTILPPAAPAGFSPQDRPKSAIGEADAPLTMYEWCDYGYPNCTIYANDILPDLIAKYVKTGKLRIVHKEFPAAGGDPSVVASLAAQCAGLQDNYQPMSKWLYRDTSWNTGVVTSTIAAVEGAAKDMGLDPDAFNTCMDKQETLDNVKQDYFEARDLQFLELPGVVIDDRVIQNGVSADQLTTVIDALLQQKETGSLPDTVVTVTPSPTPDTDFEPETVAVMGLPDAPVTIVEFTDYQCPYCQRHATQTLVQIKNDYIDTGKVRYILKNFPLTQIHPQALTAAQVAECAGEQGKYWEMHEKLFDEQKQWSGNNDAFSVFKGFAKDLSLDEKAFEECVTSERYKDKAMADQKEGIAAGVTGTPAFFINGQFVSGAQPYEVFKKMIDQMLASGQ